jgi:hypothetical protein
MLWPFLPTTSEMITKIFEGGTISAYKGVLFPKIYNHTPAPGTAKPVSAPQQPEAPTNAAS